MSYCLIGLGSNLGERGPLLDAALRRLAECPGIEVLRQSHWYETAPIGGPPQQTPYLNGAVLLATAHAPQALLAHLQTIEAQLGRTRQQRWGPRTVDLDLLLYDEQVIQTPELVVPHPRMAWRRFVLEPAAEIAPELRHPPTGWTVGQLWTHLSQAADYLALCGSPAAASLAERLAAVLPARRLSVSPPFPQWEGEKRTSIAGAIPLEFLRRPAALLAAEQPEWLRPGAYAVSDFWFGQWRAWAEQSLPPVARESFLGEWERLEGIVVPPKLIVVLPAGEKSQAPLRQAILTEARRPDRGPVLVVDGADPQQLWNEVLAAAQAIRG